MSYAVIWRENDGPVRAGKLVVDVDCLVLEGSNGRAAVRHELPCGSVRSVCIGRARGERLEGRPVVVLETDDNTFKVASLAGVGELHEIAEHAGLADAVRVRVAVPVALAGPLPS